MGQEKWIDFKLTEQQAKILCKYWNEDFTKLNEYEICTLLDKTIDELVEEMED